MQSNIALKFETDNMFVMYFLVFNVLRCLVYVACDNLNLKSVFTKLSARALGPGPAQTQGSGPAWALGPRPWVRPQNLDQEM